MRARCPVCERVIPLRSDRTLGAHRGCAGAGTAAEPITHRLRAPGAGRPPRRDVAASDGVRIRLTAHEREQYGAAANTAGFRRDDGSPAIGAWMRSLAEREVPPSRAVGFRDDPPPPDDDDFVQPAEEQPYIQGGRRITGAHEEIETHAPDPRAPRK